MAIDRAAAANAIDAFLRAMGRDAAAEPELVGTGARVADAYADLCEGYAVDARATLAAGIMASTSSSLVVLRDLPVITTCPHHLFPAMGTATLALQAREKVVGLGVLSAVVDAHARRLTLQETIGESVVADIAKVLEPSWVACRLSLIHGCMVVRGRGERAGGSRVETVAVRGASSTKMLALVNQVLGVGGGGA